MWLAIRRMSDSSLAASVGLIGPVCAYYFDGAQHGPHDLGLLWFSLVLWVISSAGRWVYFVVPCVLAVWVNTGECPLAGVGLLAGVARRRVGMLARVGHAGRVRVNAGVWERAAVRYLGAAASDERRSGERARQEEDSMGPSHHGVAAHSHLV